MLGFVFLFAMPMGLPFGLMILLVPSGLDVFFGFIIFSIPAVNVGCYFLDKTGIFGMTAEGPSFLGIKELRETNKEILEELKKRRNC